MKKPKPLAVKKFERFEKWLDKHQLQFDRDGDGVPDWLPSFISSSWQPNKSGWRTLQNKGVLVAINVPDDISVTEDAPTDIDLSAIKLRYFGKRKEILSFEISASEGVLEASSTNKVTVIGSGTGTLQLVGKRFHIDKFLNDRTAISYTGTQDDFGDDAATLTLSTTRKGTTTTLGTINVDIDDVSDDQTGTAQNDTLTGDHGRNTLLGLGANDYLYGLAGDDSIVGGAGNDTILGGAGADTLEGGSGSDVLQYLGSSAGVTIDLNADGSGIQQASGGDADGDVISGFENVYASDFGDVLIGDDDRNILFGYGGDDSIDGNGGDDVIRGGAGADTMSGGDGADWLRYLGSSSGVTIDLNADASGFQQASQGDAQGDVISEFENVQGSDFGDNIAGNSDENYILGYAGDDIINGGAGNDTIRGGAGADTLDGGADADVLQYTGSSSGVVVDLNSDASGFQQASGGDAHGDVISGFEHVYATDHDDVISGNDERNILYGYDGSDTIDGGDGKDVLRGGGGPDTFVFSTALGSGNVDRIIDFSAGSDVMQIDSSVFVGLTSGALNTSQFLANTTGLATSTAHRIIYDSDAGDLYFDSDGSGGADGILFATLATALSINETDFFVL